MDFIKQFLSEANQIIEARTDAGRIEQPTTRAWPGRGKAGPGLAAIRIFANRLRW